MSSVYLTAALVATWIVWGSTYLAIRIALPGIPPFLQMGSRFIVAGSLLLLIEKARGARMPSLEEWRSAFVVGVLLLAGGAGFTAFAERSVASGLAAAFVSFEPALMVLMSLAFGKRPSRWEFSGIALGLVGVAVLIRGDGFSASPIGLLAMTFADLCWSAGSVLATHRLRSAPGATGAASQMLCGGLILLIVSRLMHESIAHWPIQIEAVAAWLYLIVFGSMIAFTAFTYLLTHARTPVAMSYTFVNPIVALVLGAAFGGEQFSMGEMGATLVIAVGVFLLFKRSDNDGPRPASCSPAVMKAMKPMAPMKPIDRWWPDHLSEPAAVGSQNELRYAFFSKERQLIVERPGSRMIYDCGEHEIGGVSQASGDLQSVEFTSQLGPVRLQDLAVIG